MLIEAEHLKLTLNGHTILFDVHLRLDRGQIYGLLGPNGAGKSTTLAVLLGLYEADAGTAALFDESGPGSKRDARNRVGVMPEHAGFYGWMNAPDYLTWYAKLYGGKTPSPLDVLRNVGLLDIGRRPIGHFSHGMRQRLALARALLHTPELLVLDEPTNGLDPKGRREVHDLLLNLAHEQGVGVLLCTHLLDDVERLCTHVGVLDHGRTLLEGPLVDLLQEQKAGGQFAVRLTKPPPSENLPAGVVLLRRQGNWWRLALPADGQLAPEQCWRELLQQGWPIVEVRAESSGLETLYISLTHGDPVHANRETT